SADSIERRQREEIQMGLTITATFERQGIYFAGETLECHIRFSNEGSTQTLSSTNAGAEGSSGSASVAAPTATRDTRRRSTAQQTGRRHRGTVGLAAFPSLDEGSGDSSSAQRAVRATSAASTATSGLSSWLGFGGARPQPQTTLGLHPGRRATRSTASDAGSSGLLGSLWRNLSGGMPAGEGVERLAIGFAEAAGTLALSPAYVARDALHQLARQGGADPTAPVGGGLGGRAASSTPGRSHTTLPLLSAAPAVLFSELALAPGDSQTFTLRVDLPHALAPSFRGRAVSITYDIVVVAKRSMLDKTAHVVRIPFRVLAAVPSEDIAPPVFALERPLRMPPGSVRVAAADEGTPLADDGLEGAGRLSPEDAPSADADDSDAEDTSAALYARLARSSFLQQLLRDAGQQAEQGAAHVPALELTSTNTAPANTTAATAAASVSQGNILAACRRRAPVSFSLSQGAQTPATVWLPRRTYQAGDLVAGRIDMHGAPRVYHVSLWLESHEVVGQGYATCDARQTEELTRRVAAEHHAFCRANRSLAFALPAPPAAAASFDSPLVANAWHLRIELIVAARAVPDLLLSAATPFPPLSPSTSAGHPRRNSEAAAVLSLSPPPPQPQSPHVLHSPPPITPLFGAGAPASAPVRAGRTRSSTVVASTAHQLSPLLPAASARHSLDSHRLPPALDADADPAPRTMRRRYDVAAEVHTQTLACTVPIHMLPSLAAATRDARKDAFTIDLTTNS
ncbi:Golgi membrane exchange factor (Ric1p-Rgp1p) subunit, partial [Coemansia sp. RSA 2603]